MKIFVTGGAGYIASHTCLELLEEGNKIVVLDNLSNSSIKSIKRISEIANKTLSIDVFDNADISFYKGDIRDSQILESIFRNHNIDAVMHFAGLKAVGESIQKPLEYYDNNVIGSISLFENMHKHNVNNIVFSSSATVYGDSIKMPITEDFPTGKTKNPYGQTKHIIENILRDISKSNPDWNISILRYFNPIGAHPSGLIGEDPSGIPDNLMPYICKVAIGELKELSIFGNNYSTKDGTGVRDYIHVVDLAMGHISALKFILSNSNNDTNVSIFNLGTGKGTSVLELLQAFESASGIKIPHVFDKEREGDVSECWASIEKIKSILGWKPTNDILKMCEDSWRWQSKNPKGYD